MSGPVSQNSQIPANSWGYGMPPELSAFNSGLPQVFDAAGKTPVSSAGTSICHINYCAINFRRFPDAFVSST
jgi:hypothetical protein